MLDRLPDDLLQTVSARLDDPRGLCLVSHGVHAAVDPVVRARAHQLSDAYLDAMRIRCRSRIVASRVAYRTFPVCNPPLYRCGACRRVCLDAVGGDCRECRRMPVWWKDARYVAPPYVRTLLV